jgi:hypothetical protein
LRLRNIASPGQDLANARQQAARGTFDFAYGNHMLGNMFLMYAIPAPEGVSPVLAQLGLIGWAVAFGSAVFHRVDQAAQASVVPA